MEVVRSIIVDNSANAFLVIINRNKRIAAPTLLQDLGSVENVGVLDTVYRLARSDSVCIVGIGIRVKSLKLSSLSPKLKYVRGNWWGYPVHHKRYLNYTLHLFKCQDSKLRTS